MYVCYKSFLGNQWIQGKIVEHNPTCSAAVMSVSLYVTNKPRTMLEWMYKVRKICCNAIGLTTMLTKGKLCPVRWWTYIYIKATRWNWMLNKVDHNIICSAAVMRETLVLTSRPNTICTCLCVNLYILITLWDIVYQCFFLTLTRVLTFAVRFSYL